MAIAAALESEHKVLLVDASLPGTAHRQLIAGETSIVDSMDIAVHGSRVENLWLCSLAEGRAIETHADAKALMDLLAVDYSLLVVDLPPLDDPDEKFALAQTVDRLLLVVDACREEEDQARWAAIARTRGSVLGLVINRHEQRA